MNPVSNYKYINDYYCSFDLFGTTRVTTIDWYMIYSFITTLVLYIIPYFIVLRIIKKEKIINKYKTKN
jgi:hypothetical protein